MIKFLKFFLIFYILSLASVLAVTDTPSVYKITMKKVEVCETGSTDSSCTNGITLGEGSKEVDIASVTAGAAAGTFGSAAKIPSGKTYTYMQVTISRIIKIKGTGTTWKADNTCYTNSSDTSSSTTRPGLGTATAGNLDEQSVYIPHSGTWTMNGGGTTTITMTNVVSGYLSTSDTTQSAGTVDSGDDQIKYRMKLTSPFTAGVDKFPTVKVAFDVASAAYFINGGGDNCEIWPGEPSVSVTLQ